MERKTSAAGFQLHHKGALNNTNATTGHLNNIRSATGSHSIRPDKAHEPEEHLYLSAFDVIAS